MKYLIIGAGGTGGAVSAYMTQAGKDVTVIARGAHLEAIVNKGITMETSDRGTFTVSPVRAYTMDDYVALGEKPDVIFVCVKGYSLDEAIPFMQKTVKKDTIVIPILNIYGTGGRIQPELPDNLVTDSCIYIAAEIREPGVIWKNGEIFRVVFGVRKPEEYTPVLEKIRDDLRDSGISPELSLNIRRDTLQKFSYVSPAAACGLYYGVKAGAMQKPGDIRNTFAELVAEIDKLAVAMGLRFDTDIVKTNLDILDALTPMASTSMQRDVERGHVSEIDGLVYEVVRMGEQYGAELPCYEKMAAEFRSRGL